MPKLSINEMTTYRWSFEKDVANYLDAGISGIGVWRQKLTDYGEQEGIRLLNQSRIEVSNLLWAGGFTGSDGRNFPDSVKDALEAIRLAHAMKANCLIIYSGGRNGHTLNHARRLFVSALNELLPLATELEVTLAIEAMHPGCSGEWTFLNSIQDCLLLLDSVCDQYLKIAFDTYHLGYDPLVLDQIQQLAGRIAVVHLGDSLAPPNHEQNRVRLGAGKLQLREMVAAIEDTGFTGYYDVELFGEDIEASCYHDLINASKQAFEELFYVAK